MSNNFHILSDVPYGTDERQYVDIFIPENVRSDSGLILFIHGGGWVDGDKTIHHPDAQHFCNLGYVSATMNYRFVSEDVDVFTVLDDVTSALKIIKDKCVEHRLNLEKLILSGGSAGGHMALLYAYTRKNEAVITPVAACVYCPAVNCAKPDFLVGNSGEFEEWKYEILSKCCGVEITRETLLNNRQQKALKNISPEEYVSINCIPTAVFHGKIDELIPIAHIYDFVALLNEYEIKNDFLIYENSNHSLDKDPETALQSKEIIKDYAERYF